MRVVCCSSGTSLFLLFAALCQLAFGSYVVTTPRKWAAGSRAQICMTVSGDVAPDDEIRIQVRTKDVPDRFGGGGFWGGGPPPPPPPPGAVEDEPKLLIPVKVLKPHGGSPMTCDQLSIPETHHEHGTVSIIGRLAGADINETRDITFATSVGQTFVQTDKYLYKAGQKVQFRVLSLQGPFFKVSTDMYPEIFVETPSGSRIAQWKNVSNPSGLIHLDMQLIDEPEEGVYTIKVRSPVTSTTQTKTFKIEDYVLPRFEVKLKPPNYLLADALFFSFEVCATYTFGQPVKGNVSVSLHNSGWGRNKLTMNFDDQINGCKRLEVPLRTFDINSRNYFVYRISAKVEVEEEGTGNKVEESTTISITRTVLTMKDIETSSYRKPELPYSQSIKAEFPDGSPGSLEPMSVCVGSVCKNFTTDAAGVLHFTVPPHLNQQNARVRALNYPRRTLPDSGRSYMYESTYNSYGNNYYSPSNSSLTIMPTSTSLVCSPGEGINLQLPVLYAAVNTTAATLHVQVVSRGQIQYWDSQAIQLTGGEVAVEEDSLVEPIQAPFSSFTRRGTITLAVSLPSTVSPKVQVVVWYDRADGEVVSDARELEITKCLEHKVDLSWAKEKVEQGSNLPLTLTAEPSSICSLGVVDKSVQLLSDQQDSLTLDKIFSIADRVSINSWENSQINDYEYCRKKQPPKPVVPPTPVGILVSDVTPTSFALMWITRFVPGQEEVTHVIEYKEENQRWRLDAHREDVGAGTRHVVTGLQQGKVYKVRVIAVNSGGEESNPSKIITIATHLLVVAGDFGEAPLLPPKSLHTQELPQSDASAAAAEMGATVKEKYQDEVKPAVPATADFDPNVEEVLSQRTKRSYYPYHRYHSSMVDALKMFDESGLHVLSDLTLETRPCVEQYPESIAFASAGAGGTSQDGESQPESVVSATGSVRSYFPETWLWQLQSIADTGIMVQDLTLPDTITEWVGKAVCVHPTKGLGISKPSSVITFTPFFVDLTVLPSVKMGEIMPITISVFNYQDFSLPVRVTLEGSPEYEILGAEGTDAASDQSTAGSNHVCIPSNDKQTMTVRVRPLTVGDVNVSVNAAVDPDYPEQCGPEVIINKVDRIISPINVDYEGFPREKTWTKYICSKDLNENEDFVEEWQMRAPAGIVPESERAWVTVVGDLLGPTLENLGNLIKMPYGCGEQNMLNFAPNIYVHQYLDASNQGNEATNEKLKKFMRSGYQRELNYKHRDGSYSAFGESDNSGSTWLTAFVVKSFAQARPYISVDDTELAMSTEWLQRRQLENGCFESVGKVLHKGMKGGLSEGASPGVLTAYVMAALLEAGEDPNSEVITNAIYCLEAATKRGVNTKPYEMVLKTYALSLAKLPEAQQAMTDLLSLATDTSDGFYWDVPNSKGVQHHSSDSDVNPVSVEIAGYALMSMMLQDPQQYETLAHRIVKWISAQRNSQGGFISTQDTVVALQALALYETKQSQEPLDLVVSIFGDSLSESFRVQESNKLLTQRVELPTVPLTVTVDMAGTGCTLVQGVVRYNVKDPEASEAFSLTVSATNDYTKNSCKAKKIRACASYLLSDNASNMAVIEVTLVSGYIPVKEDLKRVVRYGTGIIKRYEVDGSKVMFYVDQFTERETCVEFGVLEEAKVENAKPGSVRVYDYYEPEFSVSDTYTMPQRWDCNRIPFDEILILDRILVEAVAIEAPAEGFVAAEAVTAPQPELDQLLDALEDLR